MALRILYLEDSATDATLVLSRLLQAGLDVDLCVVGTAADFVEHLSDEQTRLVMCDNAVPGISGLTAIAEVKSRRPSMPVLLLSSAMGAAEANRCMEGGASDVILKSELWRLPHSIRRAIDGPSLAAQHARPRWERLIDVIQSLSMARDMHTIMSIVRTAARELTGADGATFILREGDDCHYVDEDAIAPLWKGSRFPMSVCVSGWVMLNRAPAVIPDIYADIRVPVDAYRATFVKSLAVVPIRTESPLGAIGNYWAQPHTVTADELAILSALADTTSVAIENVQLYSSLESRVRLRTDELEASNRELEAFSHTVSHDLRSPISAIKGLVELLQDEQRDAIGGSAKDVLEMINSTGTRMIRQIDAMLAQAKLCRTTIDRQRVDLSELAEEIAEELRLANPKRAVDVTIEPDLIAQADAPLVRAVLENLMSNAWKFTARAESARVSVSRGTSGEFVVSDNGAGFDMGKADWLFAPFHRLHDESDYPGTGIGLATVKRIITRHGGTIRAESAPGQGARFSFTLGGA